MTDRIMQELTFRTTPAKIYETLTNAAEFSKLSGGAPTEIDAQSGGAFSCFGGMICGRNVECSPGERLVQAWRVKSWEPGKYSMVRFELSPDGDATRVTLEHTGYPDGQGEHLEKGWHANYWDPMKKLFS